MNSHSLYACLKALDAKLLLYWLVGFLAITWCGCGSKPGGSRTPPALNAPVVIGSIRTHLLVEQEEVYKLLKANGIKMSVDGSKVYDILVNENQARQAIELLRTNHLVLEKKVKLRLPSNMDVIPPF